MDELLQEEFYRCCAQGDIEKLKYLIEFSLDKIDINMVHQEDFCSGLTFSCMNNHMDIVDYFLHNCQINTVVTFDNILNAIVHCCLASQIETLGYLLDNVRINNIEQKQKIEITMLKLAILCHNEELLIYIILDRKIDKPDNYETLKNEIGDSLKKHIEDIIVKIEDLFNKQELQQNLTKNLKLKEEDNIKSKI